MAGDMFVAAMLDAWPEHEDLVLDAIRRAGVPDAVHAAVLDAEDHHIGGRRFHVALDASGHHHRAWRDIRADLERSRLAPSVRARAIAIFAELAEAEAAVHRTTPEAVTFHEVGAWDSIADIVAAAQLIEATGPAVWQVGSLPLGAGTVRTQHGVLPIPAPATVHLLRGFAFHDDGRPGERITPTGAAILKHLAPDQNGSGPSGRLLRSGHGFGTKRLADMPNMLRVTVFDEVATDTIWEQDRVVLLECEIDDQTSEDLALALDHLRAEAGVRDILQIAAFGKKGRMVTSLRFLVEPRHAARIAARIFEETTTLGIRIGERERWVLPRSSEERAGSTIKIATRPGGATAKVESAELAGIRGHAARQKRRRDLEDGSD